MRIIIVLILLCGCSNQNLELQRENQRLKNEVKIIKDNINTMRHENEVLTYEIDSLKTELYECDILLDSYNETQ